MLPLLFALVPALLFLTVPTGASQAVESVLTGSHAENTCIRMIPTHTVYCWGRNEYGQLGTGATSTATQGPLLPMHPPPDVSVSTMAMGSYHICAILSNGTATCWGKNNYGQLGTDSTVNRGSTASEMGDGMILAKLPTGLTANAIGAGHEFTCVVLSDHTIACWGTQTSGQLGTGTTDNVGGGGIAGRMGDSLKRVMLSTPANAADVQCGDAHACALLTTGQLSCWGSNGMGQLGLGDRVSSAGRWVTTLQSVRTSHLFTAVACGGTHTCGVTTLQKVLCWGDNSAGQSAAGPVNSIGLLATEMDALAPIPLPTGVQVSQVACGYAHTCILTTDGRVFCWGQNLYKQLGLKTQAWPIGDVEYVGKLASDMGGNLLPTTLPTGRTAVSIVCGEVYTCAKLSDGNVACWGYGSGGVLGQVMSLPPEPTSSTTTTTTPAPTTSTTTTAAPTTSTTTTVAPTTSTTTTVAPTTSTTTTATPTTSTTTTATPTTSTTTTAALTTTTTTTTATTTATTAAPIPSTVTLATTDTPEPTPRTSPPPQAPSPDNTPAILGGVIGGTLGLTCLLCACIACRKDTCKDARGKYSLFRGVQPSP